jgi:hypothetical protein
MCVLGWLIIFGYLGGRIIEIAEHVNPFPCQKGDSLWKPFWRGVGFIFTRKPFLPVSWLGNFRINILSSLNIRLNKSRGKSEVQHF